MFAGVIAAAVYIAVVVTAAALVSVGWHACGDADLPPL